jgi:hypothetical protein
MYLLGRRTQAGIDKCAEIPHCQPGGDARPTTWHARVGDSLWELSAILLLFVLDVLCVLVEEVPVSQNGQHCFMVVADTLSWPHWALT